MQLEQMGAVRAWKSDDGQSFLYHGDSLEVMESLPAQTVDCIWTDPPYNLSNNGITCVAGRMVTVYRRIWRKKQFINLVDLPYADLKIRNQEGAIGTLECVGLPGTVPAKSLGVFLLKYSGMKAASLNYQKRRISPESLDFVGSERLIKTCQKFQKLQDSQGKYLQIIPYVLTGSGNRFIGSEASIKLGSLGDAAV